MTILQPTRAETAQHSEVPDYSDAFLAEVSRSLEGAPASAAIEWAVEQFHPFLCLTASMTDAVLIDLAVSVEPSIEVVFIDTRYHFPETLETVELVRQRYGLNLRLMTVPPQPQELWKSDPENCCSAAKVNQLDSSTGPWPGSWPG
jgi:phosphoadenosine phosphosulfate reductase